jgi:hypothetical protein
MKMTVCPRCGGPLPLPGAVIIHGGDCARCGWEPQYSTLKVWSLDDPERMQALMHPPVLTTGVPMVAGAIPTERDGRCWTCGSALSSSHGEVIWERRNDCQHALCSACVWRSIYSAIWPGLTSEEAVNVASLGLPARVLATAVEHGYTPAMAAGGTLTGEAVESLTAEADAYDMAASRIRVGTDMRPFPGDLPIELAPWHEYVLDSGHCVHAVLAQHAAGKTDSQLPDLLVPLPVGVFRRCSWTTRGGGFVVVEGLTYDDEEGVGGVLNSDEIW